MTFIHVHFMRNIFDKLPEKNTEIAPSELKLLFQATDIKHAHKMKATIVT